MDFENNKSSETTLDKIGGLGDKFLNLLNDIGMCILFLMSAIMFVDILMRFLFSRPTQGVYELVQLSMIFIVSLTIGFVERRNGHICVDIITSHLKEKKMRVANNAITIFNILLYAAIIYAVFNYSLSTSSSGANLQGLGWPISTFNNIILFGMAIYWILQCIKLVSTIKHDIKEGNAGIVWLLSCIVGIVLAGVMIIWASPDLIKTSTATVGVVSAVLLFAFMLTGMPIASSLLAVSFASMSHLKGVTAAVSSVGIQLFSNMNSYNWVVICFFIMMGYFVYYSSFGEDAYDACYKWLGRVHGGLAISTVAASALMAACVGDQISSTVTMSSVSQPEMDKYGYSKKMSVGSILGGATLGPIIPPSMSFIMFGLLTGISIGDLFICGVIPGIILALAFAIYIFIICKIHPDYGPASKDVFNLKQKLSSLKNALPILILFVIIIGGIYGGIFTPTEGGAIGCFCTFLLSVIMRRFKWSNFKKLLRDSGKLIGGLFLLVIAALVFGNMLVMSRLTFTLQDAFVAMNLGPNGTVILMLLIVMLMGCFMDGAPILMICIPIFYPIVKAMGIDPIYFGCVVVIVQGMGALTPPFGVLLFAVKGLHKELSFSDICKAAIPYIIITVAVVALIMIFPGLATWLPDVLNG